MKNKYTPIVLLLSAFIGLMSCSGPAEKELITSIEDVNGKPLSVLGGSVQDVLSHSVCPDSPLLRTESETDSYMMVKTGKVAGAIASEISWRMAEKSFPELVRVGEGIAPNPVAFAVRKEDVALKAELDDFLKDYLSRTDITALLDEWTDDEDLRSMPDRASVTGENGTLRIVTSALFPPFEFVRNGEIVGAEMEILSSFAQSRNMKCEFVNASFSGLIPCLQSGKADIAACLMCITEERRKSVDFCIPWTQEYSILLVQKDSAPKSALEGEVNKTTFLASIKDSLYKSLVKEDRYMLLVNGLWSTLLISFLAAIFGTLLGMLLCFISMHRNPLLTGFSRFYEWLMGCMPQVVFLMIMFYIVFGNSELDGRWIAIIAFSMSFAACASVLFRTTVRSIDKGQSEAAWSMGFGTFMAFWNVILPQVVRRALPLFRGEIVTLIKSTSIVGYIAVFDLTKAGDIIRSRTYEAFFPLILVTIAYFLIIWLVSSLLKCVETGTNPKRKKFSK